MEENNMDEYFSKALLVPCLIEGIDGAGNFKEYICWF